MKLSAARRKRYEVKARMIKALAHPTRLFMVEELSKGERCVCELRDMVGVDISTVSKHLALLKAAGIVDDDKRGLQVFYRLKTPCVLGFFDCVQQVQDAAVPSQAPARRARCTG